MLISYVIGKIAFLANYTPVADFDSLVRGTDVR